MTDDNGATVPTVWLAALQDAGRPGALYVSEEGRLMSLQVSKAARYDTEEDAQAAIDAFGLPPLRNPGPVLLSEAEQASKMKRCQCCGRPL